MNKAPDYRIDPLATEPYEEIIEGPDGLPQIRMVRAGAKSQAADVATMPKAGS